jgi:hypothetical protein
MASAPTLASAGLMALAVLLVGFVVVRSRSWQRYAPKYQPEGRSVGDLAASQATWIWAVSLLLLVALGGSVAILIGDASSLLILAVVAAVLFGFLLAGTYGVATSRGHPHSYAVAETLGILAALLIVAIAALVIGS